MIRVNHQERPDRIACIQYRNALYQGELKCNQFEGSGLVYLQEDRHLIACKSFELSQINGPAFFVYDRHNYHFGYYQGNSPVDLSVFRIKDAVVVV